MSELSLENVQALVDGPWAGAAGALEACIEESWGRFQGEQMPAPTWYRPISRRSYSTCLSRAVEIFSGPGPLTLEVVPIWVAQSFEMPDGQWCAAHALRLGQQPLCIWESGPILEDADAIVWLPLRCQARVWDVGDVVDSQLYGPSISLEIRHRFYGVLRGRVIEVSSFEAIAEPERLARPSLEVPPFSTWVLPRVDGLSSTTLAEVQALGCGGQRG